MPRKNLPYVNGYRDRTGKMRYYLRRPGLPQVPLPGKPGSREFMRAYHWTLTPPTPKPIKIRLTPRNGHVYYLSDSENVKIGFTINWDRRKKTYLTHSGRELVLLAIEPGFRTDETALHRQFKTYRKRGDWFYPGPEILEHIKNVIDRQVCLTGSDDVPNETPSNCNQTIIQGHYL